MSSRRTMILIGAVVVGALAAFLTLSYVRGVENKSDEDAQMVAVVIAAGPIAKGSTADSAIAAKQLTIEKRRRDELPANPVRRYADIMGQVAAVDLGGGEVITTSMFVSPTALTGSNAAGLDKGNVAITITVDQAAGVAGLVKPGDNINILANYCAVGAQAAGGGGSQNACPLQRANGSTGEVTLGTPSSYLFQGVKVMAVGQQLGSPVAASSTPAAGGDATAPETTAPPAQSPLITVQLPPQQAQVLASLRDANLYLTLNRPDYTPVPMPFTNSMPQLPGEAGTPLYPTQATGQ